MSGVQAQGRGISGRALHGYKSGMVLFSFPPSDVVAEAYGT